MPVFNALLLDVSGSRLRAFNTNLGMQMFQAGFFFGPFIGAPIVAGLGFSRLFEIVRAPEHRFGGARLRR